MKVLILCGGQGTRAYPYTRRMPKALMPVSGLPIVEQVMRIYAAQGFTEFVLAVGYLKEDIIKYFQRKRWHVECIDTGASSDTGERVRRCLDYLTPTFHATYCDGLGDVDLQALVDFHRRHGDVATMTAAPLRSQYGILKSDGDDRIEEFVEKPTLREYWINAGFFVFERSAITDIGGGNLERDVLPELARRRMLRVFRHPGFWRSMDTYKDQQELDALWSPFSLKLESQLPDLGRLPAWLNRRYEVAGRGSP
jgi:glucose-1-phosphate cytidylyltransferase